MTIKDCIKFTENPLALDIIVVAALLLQFMVTGDAPKSFFLAVAFAVALVRLGGSIVRQRADRTRDEKV